MRVLTHLARGLMAICACALFPAAAQQANNSPAPSTPQIEVRILPPQFLDKSHSEILDEIQAHFADVVRLGLLSYPSLKTTVNDSKDAGGESSCDAVARLPGSKPGSFVVETSLMQTADGLRVYLTLKRLPKCEIVDLRLTNFTEETLLHQTELTAHDLGKRITQLATTEASAKAADVAVLEKFEVLATSSDRAVELSYAQAIASLPNLLGESLLSTLRKSKLDHVQFHSARTRAAAGDAFIAGAIAFEDHTGGATNVSLRASLIEHQTNTVTISIHVPLSDVLAGTDRLAQETAEVIRGRTDDQGQWQVEPLLQAAASVPALLSQASAYRQQGRVYQAILLYRKALEVAPSSEAARLELARLYDSQKNTAAALAEYQDLVWAEPNSADAHIQLGNAEYSSGQYKSAIEEFRKALTLYAWPPRDRSNILLAIADATFLNNPQEAWAPGYQLAIDVDPTNSLAYTRYSDALSGAEKTDLALKTLERALANPKQVDHPEAIRKSIGDLYAKMAMRDYALAVYPRALEEFQFMIQYRRVMEGLDGTVYNAFRETYHKLGKDKEAAKFFDAQLTKEPSNENLPSVVSLIYHDYLFQYDRALEINKQAAAQFPEDLSFLSDLTESYVATGHAEEALQLSAKVLAKRPPAYEFITMKFLRTAAFLLLDKRSEAKTEAAEFLASKSLSPDSGTWVFLGTKEFIRRTPALQDKDRKLLLLMVDLLEQPNQSEKSSASVEQIRSLLGS